MTQWKTKKGQLTDYALSCGYLEAFEANNKRVLLYKEHSFYHVKNTSNESRFWQCYDKLSEARQVYKSQCETIKS